jgi:hypothetical protein
VTPEKSICDLEVKPATWKSNTETSSKPARRASLIGPAPPCCTWNPFTEEGLKANGHVLFSEKHLFTLHKIVAAGVKQLAFEANFDEISRKLARHFPTHKLREGTVLATKNLIFSEEQNKERYAWAYSIWVEALEQRCSSQERAIVPNDLRARVIVKKRRSENGVEYDAEVVRCDKRHSRQLNWEALLIA